MLQGEGEGFYMNGKERTISKDEGIDDVQFTYKTERKKYSKTDNIIF